jgi:hypothetical protein
LLTGSGTRREGSSSAPIRAEHGQRLDLIKHVIEAEHFVLSTRIAALLVLLFGTPLKRICELTIDDIATTPTRTTIALGELPAPIPRRYSPSFHQHLNQRANRRTMNHRAT